MLGMATSHSDGLIAEHFPTARELTAAGALHGSVRTGSAFAHAHTGALNSNNDRGDDKMSKSGIGMVRIAWQQSIDATLVLSAGRSDLVHSINRCGGSKRLAAVLGLRYAETRGRKGSAAAAAEALPLYSTAIERRMSHAREHNADFIWV